MKNLILFFLFITTSCAIQKYAGTINPEDIYSIKNDQIHYEGVVPVDNANANDLFTRGKLFIAENYVSSPDVTKLEDKDSGILLIKALFSIAHNNLVSRGRVSYSLKIETKDNRYKYTITNIRYKFNVTYQYINKDFDEDLIQWGFSSAGYDSKSSYDKLMGFHQSINDYFLNLINTLNTQMQRETKGDDW